MAFYQPNAANGMPTEPSYTNSPKAPGPLACKTGRTMQVMVKLSANQSVEVRINADSPWTVGLVLTVLSVAEGFGLEYEIRYQAGPGNRTLTGIFPANSPNIRLPQ